jgi:arsenate reductase-like glutaredoxin family protein
VEGYEPSSHTNAAKAALADLGTIIYASKSCGYCHKLIEFLENHELKSAVKIKYVEEPEGKKEFEILGGNGVPLLYSTKTKKKFAGFIPDLGIIVKKLGAVENWEPNSYAASSLSLPSEKKKHAKYTGSPLAHKVHELDIVLYGSPSCVKCTRLKHKLYAAGVLDLIEHKDIASDEKALQDLHNFGVRTLPFIVSRKTGKRINDSPSSVEELVHALSA